MRMSFVRTGIYVLVYPFLFLNSAVLPSSAIFWIFSLFILDFLSGAIQLSWLHMIFVCIWLWRDTSLSKMFPLSSRSKYILLWMALPSATICSLTTYWNEPFIFCLNPPCYQVNNVDHTLLSFHCCLLQTSILAFIVFYSFLFNDSLPLLYSKLLKSSN